ncbi:MAG TPA: hypothetical protein VH912_23155 [Streptosporangiaceae bacterium]|jgi:hypothetical protein
MNSWLVVIAVIGGAGVVLLGAMHFSTDNRFGLLGLAALMVAEVVAIVYAIAEA